MKTVSVIACTIILFFAVGVAAVLLMSNAAQAGSGPPSPCDGIYCGVKEVCGGQETCEAWEVMHYRCRQWKPTPVDCDGPWTCGCYAIGCGGLCEQD